MKKIVSVCAMALFVYACSLNGSEEELNDYPESMLISGEIYNQFYNDWVEFSKGLNADQIELLNNYTNSLENEAPGTNGRVQDGVVCNCLQDQASCSAKTSNSECCICCSSGRSAVCGILYWLASCRCENPQNPGMEGRVSIESEVTVFPRQIHQMLVYAAKKEIITKEITKSFELMLNSQ